jgi:hypothetical protein
VLIDCHVHLLPPRRLANLMKWMHGFYPEHPIPADVTLAQCLDHYDALGPDYIFNLVYPIWPGETDEINRFNFDLHRAHPWIIPFGSLRVDDPDKPAIVERCLRDYGFLGLKFHPFIQRLDPLDPRMMPAYERLAAWGRPCVFHTGFEDFYGKSLPTEVMEEVARAFPRMPVVFAHSLFPKFEEAWRIVERHDNVWLDMTNVFAAFWDKRYVLKEYDTAKRLLLDGVGPHSERIMFGTDHPSGMGTLEEIYQALDRAGLRAEVRERLVGGTAERFVTRFWPDFATRLPPRRRLRPALPVGPERSPPVGPPRPG